MSDETPEPIVITPEPAHFRAGPLGFHLRAGDFFEAAELTRERAERFSPVAAFLYRRALELALKVYLLARGDSLKAVAALGHDLVQLLHEAHARGLDAVVALEATELQAITSANGDYLSHKLAYFNLFATLSRFPNHPDPAALAAVTRKVLDAVERGCYEAGDGAWKPF